MAPRKRTTRQQKNDPRTLKLEAFLRDFDSEMETRVKQLNEKTAQMLKDVENFYNLTLLKIPKAVKQMNWLEVFMSGAPEPPAVDTKRKEEAAVLNSVMAEDYASLLKSVQKTSKKKGETKSSLDKENIPSTTRKGRTTKKPPASSKRAKAPSTSRQNTSVRRSNRRPMITPARIPLDSSVMMGATPLFTPRFDPRLPQTSTLRVPRHKERVYSISVNGSPIAAGNEDIVINIPSSNGESLQLLASQINTVDLSQLDQTAVRSIRLLQNQLTALCGISE